MARIVGYIATSLDGYIAEEDHKLDWLSDYDGMEFGEHAYSVFIKDIRTIVMGRRTYDFLAKDETSWPYGAQRVFVVTSQPIDEPKGQVEIRHDIDRLVRDLRKLDDGPVWMLGGGLLQMAFMERGALDEIEIFVFPEILGGGIPLFPATGFRRRVRLLSSKALDRGCIRLHYGFD